jgi:hypothetical protein
MPWSLFFQILFLGTWFAFIIPAAINSCFRTYFACVTMTEQKVSEALGKMPHNETFYSGGSSD